MTPLELLDRIYNSPRTTYPDEPPPVEVLVNDRECPHDIQWATYRVACATLAGDWLDEAKTLREGREAIEHGERLHGIGLIDDDTVYERVAEIMRAAYAEGQERLRRQASQEALRDKWGLCGKSIN